MIERRIEAHHVSPDHQAREFRYLGEWGHARKQKMVEYTRLPG